VSEHPLEYEEFVPPRRRHVPPWAWLVVVPPFMVVHVLLTLAVRAICFSLSGTSRSGAAYRAAEWVRHAMDLPVAAIPKVSHNSALLLVNAAFWPVMSLLLIEGALWIWHKSGRGSR
jgi:hypothetical protein